MVETEETEQELTQDLYEAYKDDYDSPVFVVNDLLNAGFSLASINLFFDESAVKEAIDMRRETGELKDSLVEAIKAATSQYASEASANGRNGEFIENVVAMALLNLADERLQFSDDLTEFISGSDM